MDSSDTKTCTSSATDSQIQSPTRLELRGFHLLGLVLFLGLITSRKQGFYGEVGFHLDDVHFPFNSDPSTWVSMPFRIDAAEFPFNSDPSTWVSMPFRIDAAEWIPLPLRSDVSPSFVEKPPSVVTLVVIAVVIWALWESGKSPRHQSMATMFDAIRMLMQFVGDILMTPVYILLPGELTEVNCLPTPENERILNACPSLKRFKQMPLCRNVLFSFAVLVVFDFVGVDKSAVERELLPTHDGGVIALDWWGGKPKSCENKKILFIGSTWTGDAFSTCTRDACKYFTAKGWQCVVMVKRGCGLSMRNVQPQQTVHGKAAAPFCLSGFEDFQMAIDHVAKTYPGQIICGLGHSLGGGQLRNYVNKSGSKSKLSAAVVVDAGEDWIESICSLDRRLPLLGTVLKGASDAALDACGVPSPIDGNAKAGQSKRVGVATVLCKNFVLVVKTIANLLSGIYPSSIDEEIIEGSMLEVIRTRLTPAHGFEASVSGAMQYLRKCQFADPAGCSVPTLELFALNDLLIPVDMVRNLQQMYRASSNIITCVSLSGTHVVRWDGLRARCWMSKVAHEFLETALLTSREM